MARINNFKKLFILGIALLAFFSGLSASVIKASTDGWQPTSVNGAPAGGGAENEVWTGSEMLVWDFQGQGR